MSPLALLFRLLSPGGADGRLSVLIFHRVFAEPDPMFPGEPDAEFFDRMLEWIGHWFSVLPLDEAVARLRARALPPRALAITFDDGYADNAIVALPLLRRHGTPATFFVATDFLDGGSMWNDRIIEAVRRSRLPELDLSALDLGVHCLAGVADRRAAIDNLLGRVKYLESARRRDATDGVLDIAGVAPPRELMMTSAQVRTLHDAGMTIGAHTRSHPILARLPATAAREEIAGGREVLQSIIGSPVALFAYPNGRPGSDYQASHVAMVRELGFGGAVSTAWGAARPDSDPFQLPRFSPWDRSRARFGLRLASNLVLAANGDPLRTTAPAVP